MTIPARITPTSSLRCNAGVIVLELEVEKWRGSMAEENRLNHETDSHGNCRKPESFAHVLRVRQSETKYRRKKNQASLFKDAHDRTSAQKRHLPYDVHAPTKSGN